MSALVVERPLAILDLETTGTDPVADAIVEVAVVRVDLDGRRTSTVRRVNPERPIPPEASAVHGITDADVAHEPTFRAIAARLHRHLEGCDIGGFHVLGFDIPMLWEHFHRAGIEWNVDLERVVDAGVIFRHLEPRDLAGAVRFYLGRELEGAHGARADAEATLEVLEAILGRYPRFTPGVINAEVQLASRYDEQPALDVAGKVRLRADGEAVYTFGQAKGRTVREDPGFARWVLNKEGFSVHTKRVLRWALRRIGIEV